MNPIARHLLPDNASIDAAGIVRHSHVYAPGTVPESADLLSRLAGL